MKRWGKLLLELATIGVASVAGVFGAHRVGLVLSEAEGAQARRGATVEARAAWAEPVPVELTTSTIGTFLGIRDEIALERVRTQPVSEARFNKGGTSISLRLLFADGTRAAFKPLQNNPQTVPRKEVAAYRLNRLLGLTAVPPATMRRMHRSELVEKLPQEMVLTIARIDKETLFDAEGYTRGEVSFWIPTLLDSGLDTKPAVEQWTRWMTVGEAIPPEKVALMAQLSSLLLFDLLQNNSDRFSGGNLLTSPDGKTLYFMDNTFGFQVEPGGHEKCRTYLKKCQKFSRRLVAALRRLDLASLERGLADEPGVLSADEMQAVIARKNVALRYVDGLIAENGVDRVLVFP